ncbi:AAA family ATPase [candidate division GN15 bacterium]|nr:AAA family ATPase [candidate division GN15 bacterium]
MKKGATEFMQIIGLVGENGSGKNEVAEYLKERCNSVVVNTGDMVREIANERDLEPTRRNLHEISKQELHQHGNDYFARRAMEQIESADAEVITVTGLRTPEDVMALREQYQDDFMLVRVDVSLPFARFERVAERDKERDPTEFKDFLKQDEWEKKLFNLERTLQKADLTISNDGKLEALREELEEKLIDPHLSDKAKED